MPTYRLGVAYDGTGFHGYAAQDGLRTIQGELDHALAVVLGEPVQTAVAGRTDAGVHARGQVVSFTFPGTIDEAGFLRSLNGIVGPEMAVNECLEAGDGFDARLSARWRRYRYLVDANPAGDPLIRHQAWHVGHTLDLEAMRHVAKAILGEHDFTSFCRSAEGRSNVRRVDEAEWRQEGAGILAFWVTANAFCHQMVRSLVGFSYDVGRGFTPADSVGEVIQARDRSRVATVAPSHGLTLWEVGY